MTKDDIIRMAREAGFLIDTHAQQYQPNCILSTYGLIDENLQRFANLVAAHKAEVALAEAYRCGYEAGVVAEREACADAVEDVARKYQKLHHASLENIADECAAAIRARTTP